MTKEQLKKINTIAERLSDSFEVSEEDNSSPAVRVKNDKVVVFAGYEFNESEGEHMIQHSHDIDLTKWDVEELINDAENWLLSNVFNNFLSKK